MALRFRILSASQESTAGWLAAVAATEAAGSSPLAVGPIEDRTFEITTDLDDVTIGRRPGVEIELPFPAVSAAHARLYRGELSAEWWVEDMGSTNGSWVDGRRLAPRQPVPLRSGQRLRMGTVDILFEGWSEAPRGAESTATIARRLISDLFGAVGGETPTLIREWGAVSPTALRLSVRDRRYLAGRADGCDLVLAGEHVSREHAAFVRRWDGVTVCDLGSKNGVSVNGQPASGETKLHDRDRVEVGTTALRLTDPEDRYLQHLATLAADAPAGPVAAAPLDAVAEEPVPATTPAPVPATTPAPPEPAGRTVSRAPIILAASIAAIAIAGLLALLFLV